MVRRFRIRKRSKLVCADSKAQMREWQPRKWRMVRRFRVRKDEVMYCIDLNCDLGESFGSYKIGSDEEVIPLITSANVACGYHASDPMVMDKTIRMAGQAGIGIGAHPGFPDLMGFGRRNLAVSPAEARAYVLYQLGALYAFCETNGYKIQHIKPHGALYNMAAADYEMSKAICEGIKYFDSDLIVLTLSGGQTAKAAQDLGLKVALEFFSDRGYEEDGSLVNRRKPGALITDEELAVERVVRMVKEHKLTAITGKDIDMHADSVCVHGDGAKALEFVKGLRKTLTAEGIKICSLAEMAN